MKRVQISSLPTLAQCYGKAAFQPMTGGGVIGPEDTVYVKIKNSS